MPIGQYPPDDMFFPSPWSLSSRIAHCRQQYGVTPDPYSILHQYGGLHLEGASRILFSNGALDPWSGGGVNDSALNSLYSLSNPRGVVALLIDGAAHHLDLRAANATFDPAGVQWVRQQQRLYIQAWIDGYDTPSAENVSAGLDTKWVVLISVGATLGVLAVAVALFHFCRTSEQKEDEEEVRAALSTGKYAAMQGTL